MIRVVLDTNIVVSALLQPLGPSARIFLLALGGAIQVCVTGAIYAEYEEVIRRPRFRLSEATIRAALDAIRAKSQWVRPIDRVRVCSDPDDDPFLECCQASSAAYLVTGNTKHFPTQWRETRVVTPRRFLELIGGE